MSSGARRKSRLDRSATPVLGEGGYIVPPVAWLQGLRERCDAHGAQLVFDEVPLIQARALKAQGVGEVAISIILDEQEAIDAHADLRERRAGVPGRSQASATR